MMLLLNSITCVMLMLHSALVDYGDAVLSMNCVVMLLCSLSVACDGAEYSPSCAVSSDAIA